MRMGRVQLTCKMCGKPFTLPQSKTKNGKGKYCSVACCALGRDHKVKRTCEVCGKEFLRSRGTIRETTPARFCSLHCKGISERKWVSRNCSICGKEIVLPNHYSKRHPKVYCPGECHKIGISGENHNMWMGGISYEPYCRKFTDSLKELIRDQFGRKCFLCGIPENGSKLHVHHVDYNKGQGCGQRWSLVPLCLSCHTKTSFHRHHYFNLLNSYWAINPEINLSEV